jgi:hypothetical protein
MTNGRESHDLWALGDCIVKPLSAGRFLLVRRDTGAAAPLDEVWKPFLRNLTRFRTLPGHAAAIAGASDQFRGREPSIESALASMLPTGLFVSARALGEQLVSAATAAGELPPGVLAITTCDRPACLERVLESMAACQERLGEAIPCEVFDDSREEVNRRRNAELVASAAQRFPVRYLGPAEQERFLDSLCTLFAEDAEPLRWLLSRDHPENRGQPSYGVPLNHLMLRHAGRRLVLVDDDSVLDGWVGRDAGETPVFEETSATASVFSDIGEARDSLRRFSGNPLGAHVGALGSMVGGFLSGFYPAHAIAGAWGRSGSAEMVDLEPADSRIRSTTNGLLGDPGTDFDFKVINLLPAAVVTNEDAYRSFRESPRCLFSGSGQPVLHRQETFQRATVAGIHLDPYMAPVLPTGRGEDDMLGFLMRFLYPQDLGLRLPFALEHRPPNARTWIMDSGALDPSRWVAFAGIKQWLPDVPVPRSLDPAEKMRLAAVGLERLAAGPDAVQRLSGGRIAGYKSVLADVYSDLVQALESHPDGCDAWKGDIEQVVRHIQGEFKAPDRISEAVAHRMVEMVKRYAEAIPAWNRAFAFRRDHRAISP